ncbi:hypothetical protein Hanom_Chr09g00829191 [Helianthus anomalus]
MYSNFISVPSIQLYIEEQVFFFFFFFLNGKIWITDGPLEYHRAISGTTRSYPSPLGILPIHQFRGKPNKYEKNLLCVNRTHDLLVPKRYLSPKMPLGYKAMGRRIGNYKTKRQHGLLIVLNLLHMIFCFYISNVT